MITLVTLSLPLVQLTNYIPSKANGYVARNRTTHSTYHVVRRLHRSVYWTAFLVSRLPGSSVTIRFCGKTGGGSVCVCVCVRTC